MNTHQLAGRVRAEMSKELAEEFIGEYYKLEKERDKAQTELAALKTFHCETLKRAHRAEHSLSAVIKTPLLGFVTRGVSPQFEAMVRDEAWSALEVFSVARSNMEAWPDDMGKVETALMRLHTFALKFMQQAPDVEDVTSYRATA